MQNLVSAAAVLGRLRLREIKRRQDGGRMSELETKYAIEVDKVTKIYKLYDKPIDRLKESLNFSHKE